jgi:hypothetical protein
MKKTAADYEVQLMKLQAHAAAYEAKMIARMEAEAEASALGGARAARLRRIAAQRRRPAKEAPQP